ncbi:MAG: FAD-dependent oxidoreductase [Lachnospiraceae bacterium]|nr:FAD-dependent oxidoreductase [Lachnospiraceae bacterium]
MIRIQQLKLEIPLRLNRKEFEEYEKVQLKKKLLKTLRIKEEALLSWKIIKRSLDARKKPLLYYQYIIDLEVGNENKVLSFIKDKNITSVNDSEYVFPYKTAVKLQQRPVIVGMGPAGLFCGYFLAQHGFRPIILERGKPVEERVKDVEAFWATGFLNPDSNVQFGEGGAGTFSDGKLNTLVKEKYGRNKEVLRVLVNHGAPAHILYENKPHIGTDILMDVVKSMRQQMLTWGADIRFVTKMTKLKIEENAVCGVMTSTGEEILTRHVILAPGHSARDTFEMCHKLQLPMAAKPFAVGFRVEHPREMIDERQYGKECPSCLMAAEYKVTAKSEEGRGVYSFCMCPGGYVVNASSENGHLAVNGMSYSDRAGKNSNSAIIVAVTPEDYPNQGPLGGVAFQRQLEKKAFQLAGGKVPVQYYKDFKKKSEHSGIIPEGFQPQIKGEFEFAKVNEILPEKLNQSFIQGMEHFHHLIPGFADDYAVVAGVESRTSSPLRILRNEYGESEFRGLYPCGEGAGYAGGITSAAMDGIFIAEQVALNIIKKEERNHE